MHLDVIARVSSIDKYEGRYHDVQLPLPIPALHVVR
jgi:hypothetical protein